MGGRAVEGNGLENRRACKAYRGFESHPIRQKCGQSYWFLLFIGKIASFYPQRHLQ